MGRWWWYEQKGERAAQMWECTFPLVPNAESGNVPFWDRRANGVSRGVVAIVVPRTSRATEVRVVCVSNVIYQNAYVVRLINISGVLSN